MTSSDVPRVVRLETAQPWGYRTRNGAIRALLASVRRTADAATRKAERLEAAAAALCNMIDEGG
jgi:hypothetical protein